MSGVTWTRRRALAVQLLVGLIILALSAGVVWQSISAGRDRECFEKATAVRAAANNADWAAMDDLVDAIATGLGAAVTPTDLQAALVEFQQTRARTLAERAANPLKATGSSC